MPGEPFTIRPERPGDENAADTVHDAAFGQANESRPVEAGLEACRAAGHESVIVLGHPEFYREHETQKLVRR